MSCAYQGTNHPHVLRLLQFYITNVFELFKQTHTMNPSVAIGILNYTWTNGDRQSILDMLFAAILGVGVSAQVVFVLYLHIGFSRSFSSSNARPAFQSVYRVSLHQCYSSWNPHRCSNWAHSCFI